VRTKRPENGHALGQGSLCQGTDKRGEGPSTRLYYSEGWLLIETLLVLLVANALAWFMVAMGLP
jgi:hypothetical protein